MKLSEFIDANVEEILREWDKFAQALFPTKDKNRAFLLRDHAREMLLDITKDMEKAQTLAEQAAKSKGDRPYHPDESAANVHGMLRQHDGFSAAEIVAEFRALRATVLRLWLPKITTLSAEIIQEIVRFNESIDEAVADSLFTYNS